MKKMKLVYLISTMNERLLDIVFRLPDFNETIDYVICHQISNNIIYNVPTLKNLHYIKMNELGLSKSRNYLIDYFKNHYEDSYALITDDDVGFERINFDTINTLFKKSNADIITTKILSDGGDYKNYSSTEFVHNDFSVNRISSIEICLNSDMFNKFSSKSMVLFDERFGLGSLYKMGEEGIFLGDMRNQGCIIMYHPIYTFYHPKESTSSVIDENWLLAKGAFYKRRYNRYLGLLLLFRIICKLIINNKIKPKQAKTLIRAYFEF